MSKRYVLPILIVFLATSLAPCAFAQEKPKKEKPWKRFSINTGVNLVNNNASVRLGTKTASVSLDAEDLLGLDARTTSFKVDGYWRFMKRRRHRLDFSWFSIRRSGDNTVGISESIPIGDITIEPSARVQTELNIDIYQVGYSYSFFQDDRLDLAVGVGAFVLPIDFSLQVDNPGAGPLVSEAESITAPLPVFNLRADVAITS